MGLAGLGDLVLTCTADQSLRSDTSITGTLRATRPLPWPPGPDQLAWSTSTVRLSTTRATTATWPRRMRFVERKVRMLPDSGRKPRS